MKNLNTYVERIWECDTAEKKRVVFVEMIKVSCASKAKKAQTLREIDNLSATKLDFLAVNFAMAGEGLKVIS